jgi:hypothetical protein
VRLGLGLGMGMGMVQFEFKKLSGIKGFMNLSNFLGWAYIQVKAPSSTQYFALLYHSALLRCSLRSVSTI